MQPGVVNGATAEYHAARASLGVSQGHDEGGTQWFDSSGNTNHGTLVLAPTWSGAGTVGNQLYPAGTNYCTFPSLEIESGTPGKATGPEFGESTVAGAIAYSMVPGRTGGYAQRVQYTGVAGDSGAQLAIRIDTEAGAWSGEEPVTFAFYSKGSVAGVSVAVAVWPQDFSGLLASGSPTPAASWGVDAFSGVGLASTTKLYCYISFTGVDEGDTIDFTIDDISIEKSAILTPYFDGDSPNCSWTGTPDASTSERVENDLEFPSGAEPYALILNGSTQYVDCDDLGVGESKTCTYEAWIIGGAQVDAVPGIVEELGGGGNVSLYIDDATGYPHAYMYDDSAASVDVPVEVDVLDGELHHIVAVFDGTDAVAYADAVPGDTSALPADTVTLTHTRVGGGSVHLFTGGILVARLYPFAFDQAMVTQNYNVGPVWDAQPFGARGNW